MLLCKWSVTSYHSSNSSGKAWSISNDNRSNSNVSIINRSGFIGSDSSRNSRNGARFGNTDIKAIILDLLQHLWLKQCLIPVFQPLLKAPVRINFTTIIWPGKRKSKHLTFRTKDYYFFFVQLFDSRAGQIHFSEKFQESFTFHLTFSCNRREFYFVYSTQCFLW